MKTRLVIIIFLVCLFVVNIKTSVAYNFFNGNNWNRLSQYGLSPSEETMIKVMFLKIVYEVSLFNNSPVLSRKDSKDKFFEDYGSDFKKYVSLVDKFYSNVKNSGMPLVFSLEIADMIKNNRSAEDIGRYKIRIIDGLVKNGLW
jgi:hypothetical protein